MDTITYVGDRIPSNLARFKVNHITNPVHFNETHFTDPLFVDTKAPGSAMLYQMHPNGCIYVRNHEQSNDSEDACLEQIIRQKLSWIYSDTATLTIELLMASNESKKGYMPNNEKVVHINQTHQYVENAMKIEELLLSKIDPAVIVLYGCKAQEYIQQLATTFPYATQVHVSEHPSANFHVMQARTINQTLIEHAIHKHNALMAVLYKQSSKVIVIAGNQACGKTTLVDKARRLQTLEFVPNYTTKNPRNALDCSHVFVSNNELPADFVYEYNKHSYAFSFTDIKKTLASGKDALITLAPYTAAVQLIKKLGGSQSSLLSTIKVLCSLDDLATRFDNRPGEHNEGQAWHELDLYAKDHVTFTHCITNSGLSGLETSLEQLVEIVKRKK